MKREDARKWIWKSAAKVRGLLVLSVLGSAVDSVCAVSLSLCAKYVIDAAQRGDMAALVRAGAAAAAVILLHLALHMLNKDLQVRIAGRFEMRLKNTAFATLLEKAYSAVSDHHSGELMTRLTADVAVVSDNFATLLPSVAAMLARLVCAFAVITALDYRFACVLAAAGLILFLCTRLFRGKIKKMHRAVQESDGRLRSFLQEALENLLAVQVFGAYDRTNAEAQARGEENYTAKLKRNRWSIFANTGFSAVFSGGFLFALLWSGVRLCTGSITFGTLTALLQLVNQVQMPVSNLSGIMPKYYAMLASAERLMELSSLPDDTALNPPCEKQALWDSFTGLHLRDVSFSYGRNPVLQDVQLSLPRGEFAVLSGISGIGKSTLFKLLLGVLKPDAGKVEIETAAGALSADKTTRALFSYVPQGNLLFSGTVRENLCFVKADATEEEIDRAVRVSCADEFLRELPEGLDTRLGEGGRGLSEGQMQRLAVARAVLTDAPVLLLDEATSALDAQTERRLLQNLKALPGKTCLLISHKTAALDVCDRVIEIRDGRVQILR
ncbi:MAG TPA: ABC transporter ATP-binding protein [Candidatus Fimenecus stercoravium]|nr:ABC transporter ATP-binding protein [Candidatus Fimenecus stercoravium]